MDTSMNPGDASLTSDVETALADRNARLHAVMDALPDGVVTITEEGFIESCNPAARQLFDSRTGGGPVAGFDMRALVAARDVPRLLEAVQACTRAGADSLPHGPIISEFGVLDGDGSSFPVQAHIAPVDLADRRLAVVALRDRRHSKALEDTVTHLYHHCQITGLSHRERFRDRVQAALSAASHHGDGALPVAVLAVGLDGLPTLAERLGGEADLAALRLVGDRLREATGVGSAVGRLGTATFGVLLFPDTPDESGVREAVRDIQKHLDEVLCVRGTRMTGQWRLGIGGPPQAEERERVTADALVERAEMAMAESTPGRAIDALTLYAPAMESSVNRRRQLEAELRSGVEAEQLRLLLQPQLDLNSDRVVGAEALVRWQHPTHGWISPAQFIPLAEETGAILDIGHWVLNEACRLIAHWQRENQDPIRIGINVSPRQIHECAMVDHVRRAIDRFGIDPALLELEITESMLLGEQETILNTLHDLKALGVRLAIDDFGTGYSSLAYLRRYPMDTLKVDRAFVRELERQGEDRLIVSSVVALARGLDMEVIAEGVEDEAQRAVLASDGCDLFQGFLVARPGSYNDLLSLAASRNQNHPAPPAAGTGANENRRMPNPLPWRDSMRVGLEHVDSDHKALVDAINNLLENMAGGADRASQRAGLEHILEHTRAHFAREETIMANIGYPRLENHRDKHKELIAEFENFLENDLLDNGPDGVTVAANYVKYWFAHHLMNEDRRLITYLEQGR